MDLTKYFIGGAAITGIIAAWGQIKLFLGNVGNLFVKRDNINNSDLADDIIRYIRDNHKYYVLTYRRFGCMQSFLPKIGRYGRIGVEIFENTVLLLFVNKKPVIFITSMDKAGKNTTDGEKSSAHFFSIRGMFDVEKFIAAATSCRNNKDWHYTEQNSSRFMIKNYPNVYKGSTTGSNSQVNYKLWSNRLINFDENDLTFPKSVSDNIDRLVFDDKVYDHIKSIELWLKYKDWYKEKGIPWKTGWLLHGIPGTGKSSVALGLAQKYDLPIFIYRLGLLSSQEFTKNWRDMQSNVPCIALIEDFDNVFNQRENISGYKNYITGYGSSRIRQVNTSNSTPSNSNEEFSMETELTFDTLLNVLDGVERYEGTMTIITTNDLTKVDPALYARPGRIDKVIELGYIDKNNKIKMANNIFGSNWENFLSENELNTPNVTPASWQEKLIDISLKNLYQKEHING